MHISGYKLDSKIAEDLFSVTYPAVRSKDGRHVLVKVVKNPNDFKQLSRIKYEFELLKSLDVEGVMKVISLESFPYNQAIITQNNNSIPLIEIMKKLDLKSKLQIIANVAKTLHFIHLQGIIHRDIQTKNILVNPETLETTLSSFANATRLYKTQGTQGLLGQRESSFIYISPEQTGRMNRPVDSRTDLYSLGVTMYELLAGKPPFDESKPIELVYAHLAKIPTPVEKINSSIPLVVSKIVQKLLSKNPEDRYRSVLGLYYDLEKCIEKISSNTIAEGFPIAEQDPSLEFRVSHKIYGREKEIEKLLESFNKVTSGLSEVMLVSGYSGIGKTSLISEIYRPIMAKHGYFISGKFDQFKQNIPYSAIIQAYQDFIRQILTESEEDIRVWKEKILKALGSNGQVVINVIPDLELIIGKQPKLPTLDSTESENRFTLVFTEFQKALCRTEHPVVMFIDDLQWVDSASLKLIQMLITQEELRYLFFIGAYRDNEVGPTHKLKIFLSEIQRRGIGLESLVLKPLELEQVNQILAHTIGSEESVSLPLSKLVFEKTQGNPFFVNQFLQFLYDKKLIYFQETQKSWGWNVKEIQKQKITDNVVDLMKMKVLNLSEEARNHLKLAACIGNIFDFKTITMVSESDPQRSLNLLTEAVREGLIVSSSDMNSLVELTGDGVQNYLDHLQITFKFLHDRIHQAANQLSSKEEKKTIHLKIGTLLLKNFSALTDDEQIFEIVNHLNLAESPVSIEKKVELSKLNLLAGKKAKTSSAYEPALRYLNAGLALLPQEDAWKDHYRIMFDLHINSAEAMSALKLMKEAHSVFDRLIQHAACDFEKGIVYDKYSIFLQSSGNAYEALNISKKGLELFGIQFPLTQLELQQEVESMMKELSRPEVLEKIKTLPFASEQDVLIGRLYDRCNVGTYFADPQNLPFVICKNLKHVLDYGITPESGLAIAWFAMILGMKEDKKLSFEFGDVGLSVMSKFDDPYFKGKTDMITHGQSLCWRQTFHESEKNLNDAFDLCHSNGELQYASYARIISYISTIAQSSDCAHVLESCQIWHDYCEKYVPLELGQAKIRLYLLKGLMGRPREDIDPEQIIAEYKRSNNATDEVESLVELARMATIYGNYKAGYNYYQRAEANMVAGGAGNLLLVMLFYHGYALCCARNYATEKDPKYLNQLNEFLAKLKFWAELNPDNFFSYYSLIEAEKARACDQDELAIKQYINTINHAQKHDYVLLQACANEYLAQMYSVKGDPLARVTFAEAIYLFDECNAKDKSHDLQKFAKISMAEVKENDQLFENTDDVITSESLEITSIMKIVEVLSSTIVLNDFIHQALKILVENAGAQRVVLITGNENEFYVAAEGGPDWMDRLDDIPLDSYSELPKFLINFVKRNHDPIVLEDAKKMNGDFFSDPYFVEKHPRSVLCLPMVRYGKLCGILYFENNLAPNVFSKHRLQVLKIISTQVAISLENAYFYEKLEMKVKERTDQLELERSKTVFASRLAMLGQMAGGIAHEINNPLMIITGSVNMLTSMLKRDEKNPEKFNKYLNNIAATSDRIGKIVKSLMQFSGYGGYKRELLPDLTREIRETIVLYTEKMKQEGIELMLTSPEGKISVHFVPQYLRMILISLLNNSFDSIKNDQGPKWIKVDLKLIDHIVEISISDSGKHIPKDVQEKLFVPFFTTKDVGQGTGLSLSVAKGIVEENFGTIVFDPRSKYNRFLIQLPVV